MMNELSEDIIISIFDYLIDKDVVNFLNTCNNNYGIPYTLKSFYDINKIPEIYKIKKIDNKTRIKIRRLKLEKVKNIVDAVQFYLLPLTVNEVKMDDFYNKSMIYIPSTIKKIHLGICYNLPLEPPFFSHLTHITFSNKFNKQIDNLPATLTYLKFGFWFNQKIDNLPPSLEYLELGSQFNQTIDNLPKTLKTLILGEKFNKEINNLPANLEYLSLGLDFNKSLDLLPSKLKYISIGEKFNHSFTNFPPSLTSVTFRYNNYIHDLNNLPKTVRHIKLEKIPE